MIPVLNYSYIGHKNVKIINLFECDRASKLNDFTWAVPNAVKYVFFLQTKKSSIICLSLTIVDISSVGVAFERYPSGRPSSLRLLQVFSQSYQTNAFMAPST